MHAPRIEEKRGHDEPNPCEEVIVVIGGTVLVLLEAKAGVSVSCGNVTLMLWWACQFGDRLLAC